jgi:HNH endonuclease
MYNSFCGANGCFAIRLSLNEKMLQTLLMLLAYMTKSAKQMDSHPPICQIRKHRWTIIRPFRVRRYEKNLCKLMRCIFCKQNSSNSKSIEHIIPESIGNRKRVLPAGVVCDQCNNYFARKVEQPILDHSSFRNLRAWYQVPNKRGKSPFVRGHIGGTDIGVGLRIDRNGRLQIETERASEAQNLKALLESGLASPLLFPIEMDPPKHEMSRFLCKMALESVAERLLSKPDITDSVVYQPFFDRVRKFARYGNSPSSWPYSQREVFPVETLMRHPKTSEWVHAGFGCDLFMNKRKETLFVFLFYGIEFVINVGGPSIHGYEEWLTDHNGISPVVERVGCHLVTEEDGQSQKHYLHGTFDVHKGIEFDRVHGYCP